MTTGEILIEKLKLKHFKTIEISKVIGCPINFYFIFYYSRNLNFPLTLTWIYKALNQNYFKLFTQNSRYVLSPLLDLKNFNGNLNSHFLTLDLSGIFFQGLENFKESLSFQDLQKNKGSSPFTNFYRKERISLGNTVNRIRFTGSSIVGNDVDLHFFIKATIFQKDKDGNIVGQKYPNKNILVKRTNDKKLVDVDGSRKLEDNPDGIYSIIIRLVDFVKNYVELHGKNIVINDEIKKIIMNSYVKLDSNNPGWYFQGCAYTAQVYGGTITNKSIKKPKIWTSKRHDSSFYFLDKDLQDMINNFHVFLNSACASIKNQLRNKGFK